MTLLFHWVGWHGKNGVSIPGYDSRDPNVIGDQLSAMQRLAEVLGMKAGVIALTYGPTVDSFIHSAVMEMCRQSNERRMPFVLCFDPWTVKSATDKNAAMIAALQHADTQWILNTRSYLRGGLGKVVLDFATGVDPAKVNLAVPGLEWWLDGPDFAWPRINKSTNNNVKLPCLCLQFNDGTGPDRNKSVWNQAAPVRIIPSRAGGFYWDLAGAMPKTDYVQYATWNDYSEGTEIEPFASMLWGQIG